MTKLQKLIMGATSLESHIQRHQGETRDGGCPLAALHAPIYGRKWQQTCGNQGREGKPMTKLAFQMASGCSPARTKHAVAAREHARWLELSVLAWSRDKQKEREKARVEEKTRLLLLG